MVIKTIILCAVMYFVVMLLLMLTIFAFYGFLNKILDFIEKRREEKQERTEKNV